MADLNNNGIDDELEVADYKARAVNSKFAQQLAYGVGAAMVFGLMTGLVGKLVGLAFPAAATTAVTTAAAAGGSVVLPILALGALAAMGVGLLYLSAKFLSENTLRDQELQAKQISLATRGHAPAVEPTVQPKVQQFPEANASKADVSEMNAAPTTTISNERELADTVIPRASTKTNEAPAANWTAQVEANANDNVNLARSA